MSQDAVIVAPDADLTDVAKAMIDLKCAVCQWCRITSFLGVISCHDILWQHRAMT